VETLRYFVWLSLSCTPNSKTFIKLFEKYGSVEDIYALTEDELRHVLGVENHDSVKLADKDLSAADDVIAFCQAKNVGILTFTDPRFPVALKNIPSPPVLLYFRGVLPDFRQMFPVAVVGTRHMTDYGKKSAFYISLDLAKAGTTLVSGLALGIDGVALAAAAALSKPTVSFLGSGIDICYPAEHQKLAKELVKTGCIMTEYAPGTPPLSYHFPARNRLISGLSSSVLVIEGKEKSGSLITARHAFSQGKPVYALPGNIDREMSQVTNLLLKNGAKALMSADDIIRDFEFVYTGIVNPFALNDAVSVSMEKTLSSLGVCDSRHRIFDRVKPLFKKKSEKPKEEKNQTEIADLESLGLTPQALSVYRKLPSTGDMAIEDLADDETGIRDVMKALLQLEIKKLITMLPGERVSRS